MAARVNFRSEDSAQAHHLTALQDQIFQFQTLLTATQSALQSTRDELKIAYVELLRQLGDQTLVERVAAAALATCTARGGEVESRPTNTGERCSTIALRGLATAAI